MAGDLFLSSKIMTLDGYLRVRAAYAEFAATVIRIIEAGLSTRPDIARPLTSQSRAKDEASLRAKLLLRGLLASDNIETEIKDLAGCRLIFYTNSDADRFLQSRIVFDNFVVNWDRTKIHHVVGAEPKVEDLYRARHYIISMKPERCAAGVFCALDGAAQSAVYFTAFSVAKLWCNFYVAQINAS